ncbi:transcription-repair coupling factor [Alkalibacterium putridalgicola]|uniref:Transcription-repair-coupling factor n=1 Tax=Alkalibacterium putridalgicola TaxID=426703 RepID=A0A1H7W4R1_9LACT|nr:transcription-repair coupling factor [Alkalibacterium putridalgicola]GEK90003.1 transcription-repair-coupling factor [Alkalibacterium putridalgicola]SEM16045.1 transcription-repair coupling factor [Alkalibacterium putridalgicola]
MSHLHTFLSNKPSVQEVFSTLTDQSHQLVTGLAGSARTLLLQAMLEEKKKPIVVVTQNLYHANQMIADLTGLVPDEQLFLFSVDDMIHAEMAIASPEARADRVKALDFLLKGEPGIVVVPLAGARKILPDPKVFKDAELTFSLGDEVELDDITLKLTEMGYRREQKVAAPGEYSIRGGIVDVYPLTEEQPVRMELFDVEVDSLRYFDADTQRSSHNVDQVTVIPASDALLPVDEKEEILKRFDKAFTHSMKKMKEEDRKEQLTQSVTPVMDAIREESYIEELAKYTDLLYTDKATVIDYASGDAVLVMDEYPRILENEARLDEEEAEWVTSQLSSGTILYDQSYSVPFRESLKQGYQPQLHFALFQKGMKGLKLNAIHAFQYRTMQSFFGQMPLVKTEMERWKKQNYTVVVMTDSEERAEKVHQTLLNFEIKSVLSKDGTIEPERVQVITSSVQTGFELPQQRLAVLTEKELFNRIPKKKPRRQNITNAERLKSYSELEKGDYVVHVNHGIGQFMGMETMEINGVHQDYLSVVYSDTSKLFIPVTQLNLLQKYVSSEGKTPKLNKLGGTAWAKTKNRVAAQVEDIADDLIELYAARESKVGYGFSEDDAYQQEFDDAFPYTETDDQLRSIHEVKIDMEKKKPMDRLLVGDVGYGKTEVAMRAAFKAVQDGKQVAFLVPTTVLAQQHYETMIERFVDFPVEIGLLSRFRTGKQIKETVNGLRKGQVDIVVGTHRVLSKDIEFQDLGLLIVDEEQRFGVKHKERLKQLKNEVDVLTLTATPIPRTLHMSMLGVRDLSVIETPPANRYPVQTYVMEMNGPVVQESIQRELARGGQVFYLHNRVSTIEQRADELQQLVPEARIAYAHGQMSENQLENVLYQFIQGEFDLLVTTTIIETGVDIPNVNTLIVEDADRMGLSQLYQLRGRVGRSSRIAYAYFMHQPNKVLTEVSEKRLQAIKDFTELGSGFKIAMRDLSIRGAGNLLGQQQHGFIDSVGFDLYSQMLSEAVARKRGDKTRAKTHVEMDLSLDAYLPGSYVEDERQKIELYKRIRQFSSEEDYVELQDELIDRFGEYPQSVADLLSVGLLKMYSETALIETIKRENATVTVTFSAEGTRKYPLPEVFKALKDIPMKTDMQSEEKLAIDFKLTRRMNDNEWLDALVLFSKNCAEYRMEKEKQNEDQASADESNESEE